MNIKINKLSNNKFKKIYKIIKPIKELVCILKYMFFFYLFVSCKLDNSWCVGGKHYSGFLKAYPNDTGNGRMQIKGQCKMCRRNKSVYCSNAEIAGDGKIGNFFKKSME